MNRLVLLDFEFSYPHFVHYNHEDHRCSKLHTSFSFYSSPTGNAHEVFDTNPQCQMLKKLFFLSRIVTCLSRDKSQPLLFSSLLLCSLIFPPSLLTILSLSEEEKTKLADQETEGKPRESSAYGVFFV